MKDLIKKIMIASISLMSALVLVSPGAGRHGATRYKTK